MLHGVDATKLEEYPENLGKFDRIIFNFPHTGDNWCGGGKDSAIVCRK